MLFNSFSFIVFFAIVYSIYLLLKSQFKLQNKVLLAASYIFYSFWDIRFLSLIIISTLVDFYIGKKLYTEQKTSIRKYYLWISLAVNLGILAFFKYFNFFAENFQLLFNTFGAELDYATLNIVLPVGISFYTFQTLSYTIDIYRRKLEPCNDIFDFALFVSFFPQLIAGPIERASSLIPQIINPRKIELAQIHAGIFLIIWGFFKKIVIADNMAIIANEVFNNYNDYGGLDLFIGICAFTIQIYGDFSAYTDIARGISKMMGFELMINFKLPYFAISPSDFWNRWHISLSSWLRDYLYIPLGGNRKGRLHTFRNLSITMLLGGLWHGASWNFVLWGAFHALILIVYRVIKFKHPEVLWTGTKRVIQSFAQIGIMLSLTLFGWLLFRAESSEQIIYFIKHIGIQESISSLNFMCTLIYFSIPLLLMQFWQYKTNNLLIAIQQSNLITAFIYITMFGGMVLFGVRSTVEFIYFQF